MGAVHNGDLLLRAARISSPYSPTKDRIMVPCLICADFGLKTYFNLAAQTIGGDAVRIVRIVVVDCPVSVHITHIIRVADVRGAEPRLQPLP